MLFSWNRNVKHVRRRNGIDEVFTREIRVCTGSYAKIVSKVSIEQEAVLDSLTVPLTSDHTNL